MTFQLADFEMALNQQVLSNVILKQQVYKTALIRIPFFLHIDVLHQRRQQRQRKMRSEKRREKKLEASNASANGFPIHTGKYF